MQGNNRKYASGQHLQSALTRAQCRAILAFLDGETIDIVISVRDGVVSYGERRG